MGIHRAAASTARGSKRVVRNHGSLGAVTADAALITPAHLEAPPPNPLRPKQVDPRPPRTRRMKVARTDRRPRPHPVGTQSTAANVRVSEASTTRSVEECHRPLKARHRLRSSRIIEPDPESSPPRILARPSPIPAFRRNRSLPGRVALELTVSYER